MQFFLFSLLTLFGLIGAWICISQWLHRPRHNEVIHYYLLTHNSQAEVEWFIRFLTHKANMDGQLFQLYLLDNGSEDDTLAIIEKFEQKGLHIKRIEPVNEERSEEAFIPHIREHCRVYDLRKRNVSCEYNKTSSPI